MGVEMKSLSIEREKCRRWSFDVFSFFAFLFSGVRKSSVFDRLEVEQKPLIFEEEESGNETARAILRQGFVLFYHVRSSVPAFVHFLPVFYQHQAPMDRLRNAHPRSKDGNVR